MKRLHNYIAIFFFALFPNVFFFASASAQINDKVPVGTRPVSMGEAFTAVADDGNAVHWNPAGLAQMEHIQFSLAYADLFGLGIDSKHASLLSRFYFIPALTDYFSFGLDWFGIHAGDDGLEFSRDQFSFALALQPPKIFPLFRALSLGANIKYLDFRGRYDGRAEADADGVGFDLGALYNLGALPVLPDGLNVGVMIHDFGGTRVKHKTGRKELIQPQRIYWGLSYRPFEEWPGRKFPISYPILAIDLDERLKDRLRLGVEFWVTSKYGDLALRTGLQKDFDTDEKATSSFGIGFQKRLGDIPEVSLSKVNVEYALMNSPVLPNTNTQFGAALTFKENPRLIRIEDPPTIAVYASLYRHYGQQGAGIGLINLKNISEYDTLQALVTFTGNRYMQPKPGADPVRIPPKTIVPIALRAVFSDLLFTAPEGRLTGEVKVTYEHKNNEYVVKRRIDFALFDKNTLTWDDPGKAAAFITDKDALVQAFVTEAQAGKSKFTDTLKTLWFSRYENVVEAMTIFNAVQAYGVNYRRDPVTPMDSSRGASYRRDIIKYPGELLSIKERAKRGGDCDDLAVLYASLLQNVGITTALVSGPGHIFMMFDSGIPYSNWQTLPIAPDRFDTLQGKPTLWIPIETTMLPDSSRDGIEWNFGTAWDYAADRLASATHDTVWKKYEVPVCQNQYPPVPPEILKSSGELNIPDVTKSWAKSLSTVEKMKINYFQLKEDSLELGLPVKEKLRIRNEYGILLAQNKSFSQAADQFSKILESKDDSTYYAQALNNIGNVEFILGNFVRAKSLYEKALRYAIDGHGNIYLNLALLYQMMIIGASQQDASKYQEESMAAILQAAKFYGGNAEDAFSAFRYPPKERDTSVKHGVIDWASEKVKKAKDFVDKCFKKYLGRKEIKAEVMDTHAAKGQGMNDAERSELVWWSY